VYAKAAPRWDGGLGLDLDTSYGGPDNFVLYQLAGVANGSLRLTDSDWLQGTIKVGLADNYDQFNYTAPSNLPRVRTDVRLYMTTSQVMMSNLQATHVGKLSENNYYSVYAGYLEPMYAGVGAEWLYRPFGSRVAIGADVNQVKQRDYDQHFGLLDYTTTTGHATLYWDTGWNGIQADISAGRYLAKDWGATLNVYREFKNGVRVGAFATKTNVSAQEFGEGSFDKGVYLQIPFDAMLTRSSPGVGSFVWRPLTRDGGAMLERWVHLYGLTSKRDPRTLERAPAPQPNDDLPPEDRKPAWQPKPAAPLPYTQRNLTVPTKQWRADPRFEERLNEALYRQGFRNIAIAYDYNKRLSVTLGHEVFRPISLAVGRAARVALALGPLDMREIEITFIENRAAVARYSFADLERLRRYYAGEIDEAALEQTVAVRTLERPAREANPLAQIGNTQTQPAERASSQPLTGRVIADFGAALDTAREVDWLKVGALGAGLVAGSMLIDKWSYDQIKGRVGSKSLNALDDFGSAIPWVGFAGAALAAFDDSDPRRSRTGYAAVEAGATALALSTGLKIAFGRARPSTGLSHTTYEPFTTEDRYNAFPSRHVAAAWALATPFALEYDMPWLYGVAALSNAGRIASGEHWVSDTVAGALLGYGIGRIFWESSRPYHNGQPRLIVHSSGIDAAWSFD